VDEEPGRGTLVIPTPAAISAWPPFAEADTSKYPTPTRLAMLAESTSNSVIDRVGSSRVACEAVCCGSSRPTASQVHTRYTVAATIQPIAGP
jgi:hypothetical protein